MKDLSALRKEIDAIDNQIVDLLARRFKITHEIGHIKKDKSTPPVDKIREEQILNRLVEKSKSLAINPELVHSIFTSILSEVVAEHQNISKR